MLERFACGDAAQEQESIHAQVCPRIAGSMSRPIMRAAETGLELSMASGVRLDKSNHLRNADQESL
jgi:hypothetical protein